MKKIAIIGCGNMASAIVKGWHQFQLELEYHMYTPSFTRAKELADFVDGVAHRSLDDMPQCDYYLLGFKPQQLNDAASTLKFILPKEAIAISLLAGKTKDDIANALHFQRIIRIMPNTPIELAQGISLLQAHNSLVEGEILEIKTLFEAISEVVRIEDDETFDLAMMVAASGPAYLFTIANHLAKELDNAGIERSQEIAKKLFLGSSLLMNNSKLDLSELAAKVTSKGGVTQAALEVFKQNGLEQLISNALKAGMARSSELRS
jgi:pyrroline-5-carboxylate reductase